MSTLVAQTISNGTVSTSSANVIQGSAKAWVNFNGSTAAIRASYNVSSITKVGTGLYYINFTNALADTNYCVQGTMGNSSAGANAIIPTNGGEISPSTTSIYVGFYVYAAASDPTFAYITVFR
jgi:hypothetical protein